MHPSRHDILLLSSCELFAGFDPEEVTRFLSQGIIREYPANHVIFREHDHSDGFASVVIAGKVQVTMEGKHVAILGPGEVFGEYALASEGARTGTVTTQSPVRCVAFNKQQLDQLLPLNDVPLSDIIIKRVKENSSAKRGVFKDGEYIADDE